MTIPEADRTAPDLALIERLAHAALADLPEPWRGPAAQVVLRVADFPPEEILSAMEIADPFELTGLYEGTPLTEKSVAFQAQGPDVVWLFRRPLLDEWVERGDITLTELVTHVVVHELAHHFGWSDDDIASVDQWWE